MRPFRSLMPRLVFSYTVVAVFSIATAYCVTSLMSRTAPFNLDQTVNAGADWLLGAPDHSRPNPRGPEGAFLGGFSLVVAPDNRVLYSQGETACRAGMILADCAPDLLTIRPGERYYSVQGQPWWETAWEMPTGQRIISQRSRYEPDPSIIILGGLRLEGYLPVTLYLGIAGALQALPLTLILSIMLARLQTRRIRRLAQVSRRFAGGELAARVPDRRGDVLGKLGQQFNSLADALTQHLEGLRTQVLRHAELAARAEQAARTAERARLARDLYELIASRLSALSRAASALQARVGNSENDAADPESIDSARSIAVYAEDTLLQMRRTLTDLRIGGA